MALTYVIFSEIIILTSIAFTADGKCIPADNGLFRFGPGCDFMCHCLDEKEQCNRTTGDCVSGCDWEWGGPGCQYKNIALGVQSRHLDNLPEPKSSRLANDKNLSTCSKTDDQNASRKQNQPRRDNPWWKIMFPRNETFRELSFVTKPELLTNFSNFTVTVEYVPEEHKTHKSFNPDDIQVCYEQRDKVPKSTMITVICNRPLVGNQLRIQLGSLDTQLVLCDIRIFQGRNLVSKSSTNQSFSKAVDGYPYTCSYTTNDRLYWDADFVFVANIRLINITAYDKNCQNFSLSAFNGNEWILLHWEIYICKTAEIMQEVSARYIRLERVDQGWFGLCEVQIFGDCHDDVCGFDCKQVCHCRNTNLEDKVSGVCSSGCKGRWTGTNGRCDKDCDETHWGPACQHECGRCKNNEPCNVENGYCLSGCIDGYQPPTCNDECKSGTYGKNCANFCSGNCLINGEVCTKSNGRCLGGCKPGFIGDTCDRECLNGTYGLNCSNACSRFCNGVCDKVNGTCSECTAGWTGSMCSHECPTGTYGLNCSKECSPFCTGDCDKVNGTCSGCSVGWTGVKCSDECQAGTHGNNCSLTCSPHCDPPSSCLKSNGHCHHCQPGWKGLMCNEACTDGTYGLNCSHECSPFCSSVCNKGDGTCSECRAGWKGQNCSEECSDGTWGYECKLECGKCFGKGSCAKDAGICREGCQAGYRRTEKCEIECENGTYGIGCNETCGNCKDDAICDKTNGSCMIGCSQGFAGDLCSIVVEQPQGIVVDVAISVGSVMVLLSISFAAVLLIIRSFRAVKSTNGGTIPSGYVEFGNKTYTNAVEIISNVKVTERAGGQALVHLTAKENEHNSSFAYHNAGACLKEKSEHAVDISDFKAYVKSRFANEDSLIKEFQKLPEGLTCSVKDARIPENIVKNRYKDMVAYDHSRVVLKTLPNQPYSDYINASFIKGHCVERAYIASQGPNDANLKDVWRMIWEQDVRTIVMITNLVEEAKIKCIKYWPECEASVQFGSVHIETEREHIFAEFTVRYFKLSNEENPGVSRTVTQFHYTAWPDKNIPRSTSSLLHFWRKVRQNDEKKSHPWLVHCSAGVGRTGTFLAIDILYDQGKDLGYLDVFQCVRDLREQRVNMVQTKEQYMYLHVVMVEAFVLPSTPVKIEQFPTVYKDLKEIDTRTGKTKLLMEYEVLRNEVRDQANEGNSGACEISKNGIAKSSTKLTGHKINDYRPLLRTDVPGSSNNINALYISSYRDANAFVLTPTPMTNTVVDFCRLLHDQDIKVIVTFSNDWNEQVGICFPESGSLPIGPFTICFVSEEDRETHRLRTYTCRFKDNERTVTHLIFNKWPLKAIVPTDPYKMYNFLQYLETLKRNNYKTPVILQCLNGTERSGLVAVLMNVLEHARFDGEVSIPQVIRHLRFKSRQIIPNFEQYKFCYDVLLCFTESNPTYANM